MLKAAIEAAHAHGARVTAHVFSEDALPGLINAGIDCIEHGTGLTDDTIELMVEHGTVLVPDPGQHRRELHRYRTKAAERYPAYAAHMRDLHARALPRLAAAREAGVPIYAGSDAGTMVAPGRIADEVEALKRIGMSPTDALGAACWDARRWLGRPRTRPRGVGRSGLLRAGPEAGARGAEPPRSGHPAWQDVSAEAGGGLL